MKTKYILCFITAIMLTFSIDAQISTKSDLYQTLKIKDSLIFDYSFESCNMSALAELISADFEFYHDKGGVLTSRTDFIDTMKNGICNQENTTRSRRQLDPSSMEVYPLKDKGEIYGVIQTGIHRFFETTNGNETSGSVAKFSHLWILEDGDFKLKRVLSYDHKMPENKPTIKLSDLELKKFLGSYTTKAFGVVTISTKNEHLLLSIGDKRYDLFPISKTVFKNDQRPLTFKFVFEGEAVNQMIVMENDNIVEQATRI